MRQNVNYMPPHVFLQKEKIPFQCKRKIWISLNTEVQNTFQCLLIAVTIFLGGFAAKILPQKIIVREKCNLACRSNNERL